jgi:selenocysteine lyase/cysteine desulfurase
MAGTVVTAPRLAFTEDQLAWLSEHRWYPHFPRPIYRLNHGSFGAAPLPVLRIQNQLRRRWYEQPDEFYFFHLPPLLSEQRQRLARVLHVEPQSLCFVENVTTAVALVVHSLHRHWGLSYQPVHADTSLIPPAPSSQRGSGSARPPVVLICSNTYFAVKQAIRLTLGEAGLDIVEVPLPFPLHSQAQLLEAFQTTLQQLQDHGRRLVLAVIDHISSVPSFILPLDPLVKLIRRFGVERIFVDGAHAFGQVALKLPALDIDYYTSNIHKWGLAPTSVGTLFALVSSPWVLSVGPAPTNM